MYDKFGLILRVETVINQPGEFKVFRECWHRDGSKSLGWYPMCKGVGNFHHYQSHALACNLRYLEALAAVEDPAPAYDDLRTLTERQRDKGAAMRASIPPERRRPVCSPLCWRVITSPKVFATKTSARLCMLTTRKTGIVSVLPSDGCSSACTCAICWLKCRVPGDGVSPKKAGAFWATHLSSIAAIPAKPHNIPSFTS